MSVEENQKAAAGTFNKGIWADKVFTMPLSTY